MKLVVGDKVSFVNESGQGCVTRLVDADLVMILDNNGFERPFKISEIIKLDQLKAMDNIVFDDVAVGYLDKKLANKKIKAEKLDFKAKLENLNFSKLDKSVMEIDLHIHELLDEYKSMTNYEIVSYQMGHFERMLETAIKNKCKKIIFIHGVGQGVLKNEIRKVLAFYPGCTFHDASFQRYGQGATEVVIRF